MKTKFFADCGAEPGRRKFSLAAGDTTTTVDVSSKNLSMHKGQNSK